MFRTDLAAQLALAAGADAKGDVATARAALRQAVATGDLAAQALLGRHLLTRSPFLVDEGIALSREAANRGSADAAHLLAVITGSGLGVAQDWHRGLDLLHQAFQLGHPRARDQLVLLTQDGKVDLNAWLAKPPQRIVSPDPRIAVVENFVPAAICDWLIELGRPLLKRAQVLDAGTGDQRIAEARTNSAVYFDVATMDFILVLVRARISALTGIAVSGMEAPSVLHYRIGEFFAPHYDFLEAGSQGYARELAPSGSQRVMTFLLYLSDDYDAGETDFSQLGWRHKGRKGDAMFFWNVTPDGKPDRRMLHAGLAPTRGEKWLFSQWIQAKV